MPSTTINDSSTPIWPKQLILQLWVAVQIFRFNPLVLPNSAPTNDGSSNASRRSIQRLRQKSDRPSPHKSRPPKTSSQNLFTFHKHGVSPRSRLTKKREHALSAFQSIATWITVTTDAAKLTHRCTSPHRLLVSPSTSIQPDCRPEGTTTKINPVNSAIPHKAKRVRATMARVRAFLCAL